MGCIHYSSGYISVVEYMALDVAGNNALLDSRFCGLHDDCGISSRKTLSKMSFGGFGLCNGHCGRWKDFDGNKYSDHYARIKASQHL